MATGKRVPKYECVCPGCGTQFLGKQRNSRYCSHECYVASWHADHPEQVRSHKKKYQHSEHGKAKRSVWEQENEDELRQKASRYYLENRDAAIARAKESERKNPERARARKNAWQKTEKGRRTSLQSTRRRIARKFNAPGAHTIEEFLQLCADFDDHCLCCLKKLERKELSIDHVVPISKGGSDGIENLQPLCRRCNVRKGVFTIDYRPTFWWRGPARI